jgi:hypothetical protein
MHSALTMMNKHLLATILLAACTSTAPGARPHDMSSAQHEREANREADAADRDASKYDPNARVVIQGCGPYDAVCWRSKRNPTAEFRTKAEEQRRAAAEHRAASAALREAEAKACVGVDAEDRDISPFERSEDIARVEPLTEQRWTGKGRAPDTVIVGARVVFLAVPGLTAEKLQREVDCHLARASVLGHNLPEMPDCPLVPNGAKARVLSTAQGLAVEVRADDQAAATDIVARAERLKAR